jgi:hypothetical protein
MPSSTSNLSIDKQQAAAAAATKRKKDDATAVAQSVAMAAACKTLDETRTCKHVPALTWEKEKTIARHLEQQLAAAQGITIPQDDDEDHSINAGSNPNAALTPHLHAHATGLQNK